jgi:hypothetical protein
LTSEHERYQSLLSAFGDSHDTEPSDGPITASSVIPLLNPERPHQLAPLAIRRGIGSQVVGSG